MTSIEDKVGAIKNQLVVDLSLAAKNCVWMMKRRSFTKSANRMTWNQIIPVCNSFSAEAEKMLIQFYFENEVAIYKDLGYWLHEQVDLQHQTFLKNNEHQI
jgi:hypothetical protein